MHHRVWTETRMVDVIWWCLGLLWFGKIIIAITDNLITFNFVLNLMHINVLDSESDEENNLFMKKSSPDPKLISFLLGYQHSQSEEKMEHYCLV